VFQRLMHGTVPDDAEPTEGSPEGK
jgi:hypothetical protein